MSAKGQKPPAGKPWVWLTRELLDSAAWQSLGISARRVLDCLMIEHMRHAGKRNGILMAPRRQIIQAGVHPNSISDAIEHLIRVGLIDVQRGVGRRPSLYALLWLPYGDGTEPSDRWKSYRSECKTVSTTNEYAFAKERVQKRTHKARSECNTVLATRGAEAYSPSRTSYQAPDKGKEEGGGAVAEAVEVEVEVEAGAGAGAGAGGAAQPGEQHRANPTPGKPATPPAPFFRLVI